MSWDNIYKNKFNCHIYELSSLLIHYVFSRHRYLNISILFFQPSLFCVIKLSFEFLLIEFSMAKLDNFFLRDNPIPSSFCATKISLLAYLVPLFIFFTWDLCTTMVPTWPLVEMSKWVSTREPTRLTTGSSRVGLRKIQLFQKWVELNPAHLTHGLNGLKVGWPT